MKKFLTVTEMINDIADRMYLDPEDVANAENVIDLGMDSVYLPGLVRLWQQKDVAVTSADLLSDLSLDHWKHVLCNQKPLA